MTQFDYKKTIEYLILGEASMIENEDNFHSLVFESDGDGWNEPFSDSVRCSCGEWEGAGWVQVDPQCTGRLGLAEYAMLWVEHIDTDVWTIQDELDDKDLFDGNVSQDSDPF